MSEADCYYGACGHQDCIEAARATQEAEIAAERFNEAALTHGGAARASQAMANEAELDWAESLPPAQLEEYLAAMRERWAEDNAREGCLF
jgi:hypothetical protein